jgi:hypothetical protein
MKQECKDCNKSLEDCTCLEDTIELPNQALIEAAENYNDKFQENAGSKPPHIKNKHIINHFINGAKWQQERSYSEEDLKCAWDSSDQNMRFQFSSSAYKAITFKQWLEKFKEEKDVINR